MNPKSNITLALDDEIATGRLTLRRLSLERQLKEVRLERQHANGDQERLIKSYTDRMAAATKRFQSLVTSTSGSRSACRRVAKEYYPRNCGDYVVRKHAQLLHLLRSQQILESYVSITQEQYGNMIERMRETHHDMFHDLQDQRSQHEAQKNQIHNQMVTMVAARVMTYYKSKVGNEKANSKHQQQYAPPILIQRLVNRKNLERRFMSASVA